MGTQNKSYIFLVIFTLFYANAAMGQTVIEKLDADFRAGVLSRKELAVNLGYALKAPDLLPEKYKSEEPISRKCGFTERYLIQSEYANMTPDQQRLFKSLVFRANLPESYISESGRFKIHYTTFSDDDGVDATDSDGSMVPDWIEEVSNAFESAHRLLIDTLGYRAPLPDFGVDGDEFDVYIYDLDNLYGEASPIGNGTTVPSFIAMDNDFLGSGFETQGFDAIRVTAVHEYFHSVQLAYILRGSDFYFYEMASTWIEEIQYDEINDYYQYLDDLFLYLDRPINFSNKWHEYGMSIWLHFLMKRHDTKDLVRKMWEQMPNHRAINVMKSVIDNETSSNFETELTNFYVWNYFTGSRANPELYYDEGEFYPEVTPNDIFSLGSDTTEADTSLNLNLNYLSANYIVARRQQPTKFFADLIFDRADRISLGGAAIANNSVNESTTTLFPFFLDTLSSVTITNEGLNPELVVIPVVTSLTPQPETSSYSVTVNIRATGPPIIDNNILLPTNPSPANFSKTGIIEIPFVILDAAPVEIKVYTSHGRLVKTFPEKDYPPGLHPVPWDGRDNNGNSVPSGIYVYVINSPILKGMKKMAVIR